MIIPQQYDLQAWIPSLVMGCFAAIAMGFLDKTVVFEPTPPSFEAIPGATASGRERKLELFTQRFTEGEGTGNVSY